MCQFSQKIKNHPRIYQEDDHFISQEVLAGLKDLGYLILSVFKHTGSSVHYPCHYKQHKSEKESGQDPFSHSKRTCDQETYDKAAAIRFERAGKLGRLNRKKSVKPAASLTGFRMAAAEQHYEDPRLQAEYLYSLIESEVS